jgi:HK97 gp10 family phage protein
MAQHFDTSGYSSNERSFELTGFSELEQLLRDLGDGINKDQMIKATFVKAAKVAMEPVYNAAIAYAPYDEVNPRDGKRPIHMRDTIKLTAKIPTQEDLQSSFVNEDTIAVARVTVKRSAVSLAQEFGTSKIPARPFLRPALDWGADTVLSSLKSQLSEIIPAYVNKLARKK